MATLRMWRWALMILTDTSPTATPRRAAHFLARCGALRESNRAWTFKLDSKKYSLPINNAPNSLHGGPHGFNNVVWKAKQIADGVELTYLSKDGEAVTRGI